MEVSCEDEHRARRRARRGGEEADGDPDEGEARGHRTEGAREEPKARVASRPGRQDQVCAWLRLQEAAHRKVILADSSVLIDVLRARRTAASDRLREVVRHESTWGVPLPCVLEVLQGARDEADWRVLRRFFESQRVVEPRSALQ